MIVHSAYLHPPTIHILAAFTRQGSIATGVLPLAFMLRLPQQAYDARQDCRDAIEFLWRCLADMKPGIADTRSGRRPVKSFSCSEQEHRSRL